MPIINVFALIKIFFAFFVVLRVKRVNYYKFDFAVFKDNGALDFLIEYQGNIHFKTGTGWNNEEALKDCQKRDKIKFEYCQEHNIKLYYITYEEIIEDRLEEIFSE